MDDLNMITIAKRQRQDGPFSQRKFFKKTAKGKVLKGERARTRARRSSPALLTRLGSRSRPVIRERYVRNDIPCGSASCELCLDENQKPVLPEGGFKGSKLVPKGHFVVPDTNAFLHQVRTCSSVACERRVPADLALTLVQMDLLTSPHLAALPIIVLQTVLEEVRHRSLPLFNRLKQLIADEDRTVWVFWNEARRDSATIRIEDETPNDRNDRCELNDGR